MYVGNSILHYSIALFWPKTYTMAGFELVYSFSPGACNAAAPHHPGKFEKDITYIYTNSDNM
jgi:hypothetical protein